MRQWEAKVPDRGSGFVQRTAIAVGLGSIERLPTEARRLGSVRPVVLIDAALAGGPIDARVRSVIPDAVVIPREGAEPSFDSVARDAALISDARADGVVAVGGGSTLDTAKLARGLLAARVADLAELPEILPAAPLPLVAVPTTAGTGAEIGAGAIVFDPRVDDKILIRRPELVADVAIADGDLTVTLPPTLTAWTGCDALGQAILAYVPAGWDSVSGQTALRAIRLIFDALPRAVENGLDREARRDQMLGSVLSALAMFNSPPTYAGEHVFAEPVGAALHVHHGFAVAAFLAGTVEFNVEVLADRFAEISLELGLAPHDTPPKEAAHAFADALRRWVVRLGIPSLRQLAPEAEVSALAARCARHDGYSLNPRPIGISDAEAIVRGALSGSWRVEYAADAVAAVSD
jgi:alcohol dehydrogenase class IV